MELRHVPAARSDQLTGAERTPEGSGDRTALRDRAARVPTVLVPSCRATVSSVVIADEWQPGVVGGGH